MPEPLLADKGKTCGICRSAHVLSGRLGHLRQGAHQARICPRGFLVGCCSACSASRFPRTSLRVRGFAGAGGVVDFGVKRAGDGAFGCSACDVCFIRSAQFSARAQNLMKPRHTLPASPRSPPTVAARTRIVPVAASCTRACELSLRSRFGDDLVVEPSHGVDSERGEIEVDRLYPELAHGAQV